MTSTEPLLTVDRDGEVAVVTLRNPKVNALSIELLEALAELVAELRADLPAAIVITGGTRLFAAGADIAQLADPSQRKVLLDAFRATFDALAAIPCATIAAVRGFALGGGLELALACDFRFVASDATLGQPEALLGLIPGAGGTQRLTRLVGPSHAKDLVMTGRAISADEAARIGLVNRVCEPEDVLAEAVEYGRRLGDGARLAQQLAKAAIDRGVDLDLGASLTLERELFETAIASDDGHIGMTSFLERGPGHAQFTGR
jgi:enoyl-CoA hydratase/carnithine racemase